MDELISKTVTNLPYKHQYSNTGTNGVTTVFWFGLHDTTSNRIKLKLKVTKPDQDNRQLWTVDGMFSVGKKVFSS